MIVYHGGYTSVVEPKIITPSRSLDFGSGFYATTSLEQAQKWSLIKKDRFHYDEAVVSWYEFDDTVFDSTFYKCLFFKKANEEWLDFVISNRRNINFNYDYDIVRGAVANDNVYASLNLYENGFISKEDLLKELRTWVYVDQICFHTKKSLECLKYIKSEEVK